MEWMIGEMIIVCEEEDGKRKQEESWKRNRIENCWNGGEIEGQIEGRLDGVLERTGCCENQ
jgi:hypothetical protein